MRSLFQTEENKLASKKQKDDNIKSFNHTDRNNNFGKEVMRDSDGLVIINSKNKQSPSMRFFESIGLGSSARVGKELILLNHFLSVL